MMTCLYISKIHKVATGEPFITQGYPPGLQLAASWRPSSLRPAALFTPSDCWRAATKLYGQKQPQAHPDTSLSSTCTY